MLPKIKIVYVLSISKVSRVRKNLQLCTVVYRSATKLPELTAKYIFTSILQRNKEDCPKVLSEKYRHEKPMQALNSRFHD